VRVYWPQSLFADGEGLLVRCEGLIHPVLRFIEARQAMKCLRCLWMLRPSPLAANSERPLIERLGFWVAALLPVEIG
jgi:hypothetical protein